MSETCAKGDKREGFTQCIRLCHASNEARRVPVQQMVRRVYGVNELDEYAFLNREDVRN